MQVLSCTVCWPPMFTYGATGVGSAVKKRARHPHDFRLHLPHAGEDVRVERVAPCKISINLPAVGTICMSCKYLQELRHNLKDHRREWKKRRCGGGNVFTAAKAKQVNPFTTTVSTVYNKETRYQPSPGVWSVTHHPSTPHQTHTLSPNPPRLQDKQRQKTRGSICEGLQVKSGAGDEG